LTNAAGGGAFVAPGVWSVTTNWALSSRPTTPETMPDSESGIVTSDSGERTVSPPTLYSPNVVPNAASACATVPSAET